MEKVKRFKTKEDFIYLFSFEDRGKSRAPKCRKFQRMTHGLPSRK